MSFDKTRDHWRRAIRLTMCRPKTDYFMHPTFGCIYQKILKKLFGLKNSKNTFGSGTQLFLCPLEALQCSFWKFGVFFIPSYRTIILYSFLLAWITFLSTKMIMHVFEDVFH